MGKHDLVIRFLRGARRLNPPRPHLVPSWDLPSVLTALKGNPFEPLQSVELKFLSLKTVLLAALAMVNRVGDLQAFSVDDPCLEFGPGNSHVVLILYGTAVAVISAYGLSYLPYQLVWGDLPASAEHWRGSAMVAFSKGSH